MPGSWRSHAYVAGRHRERWRSAAMALRGPATIAASRCGRRRLRGDSVPRLQARQMNAQTHGVIW